jgi:hypothetical protein
MTRTVVLLILLAGLAAPAWADIYRWQDAAGVTHFSNGPPPAGARLLDRIEETPYDSAADRQRLEEERRFRLEHRQLEIEEEKARAAALERESQLRFEQERARQLEALANSRPPDDGDTDDSFLRYGTYYGPGYYRPGRPGDPNLYRGYYRENNNLYYKRPTRPIPPHGPRPTPYGHPGPGPGPGSDDLKSQSGPAAPRTNPGSK